VGLEVGLPEALAGPVGQRGHSVGLDADPDGNLGRRQAFDLGQPQHCPPAHGEGLERLTHQVPLQPEESHVVGLQAGRRLRKRLSEVDPALPPQPIGGGVADAGQKVGAERDRATGHPGKGGEHPGETFGHGVVGVGRRRGAHAGHLAGRLPMTEVEGTEGGAVTLTGPDEQLLLRDDRAVSQVDECVAHGVPLNPLNAL
jgi:hypothetical protein